jgi:hypothetical protein
MYGMEQNHCKSRSVISTCGAVFLPVPTPRNTIETLSLLFFCSTEHDLLTVLGEILLS